MSDVKPKITTVFAPGEYVTRSGRKAEVLARRGPVLYGYVEADALIEGEVGETTACKWSWDGSYSQFRNALDLTLMPRVIFVSEGRDGELLAGYSIEDAPDFNLGHRPVRFVEDLDY